MATPDPAAATGASQGALRALALDQALDGCRDDPSPFSSWARNLISSTRVPARGVATAGLPEPWRKVLAWSGIPLSPQGALLWGSDLAEDAALEAPHESQGRLLLPSLDRLADLSGLGLRPLRRFIAERCQVRLQTAPGVRMWIWPDRALLVSLRDDTVGGFLYAPTEDQRSSVLLEAGAWQMIRWSV